MKRVSLLSSSCAVSRNCTSQSPAPAFRVQGLGFGFWVLGFRFGIKYSGLGAWVLRFRV